MIGLAVATLACRGREGTRPEDMSAEAHDAAAASAEAQAVEHRSQYDPDLVVYETDCSKLCFRGNPTDPHRQKANQLRREAKRHRDASHELRVAEARACAGIPELHRDLSPFYHRIHITGVEIGDEGPIVVHFDRIPKTTAVELQHMVDCHLARNAAVGFTMSEMDYCPLAIPGVSATVVETHAGFDIQLGAADEQARAEVASRVESLLGSEGE
jgi:hypothetical protein